MNFCKEISQSLRSFVSGKSQVTIDQFKGEKMNEWRPISTAPKDGTWILGMNNRGNPAVIIWSNEAMTRDGRVVPGWIHPFSEGYLSDFWNGACGSVAEFWMPILRHPNGTEDPYWNRSKLSS